ncbi:anti-anti-sigma factor [candidate division KSB3 bacterium]|uniref:Anti-sigma factor antagonist n=1 Tax=candidate division KSB3 bacterium TaxID=2044937 RepID=A0A2G6E1T4_9BACT|nr:MAG: anti-anti-sigma factor [candidate division KSB3 bacterium]
MKGVDIKSLTLHCPAESNGLSIKKERMAMDLQIETRSCGTCRILDVNGEVDLYSSPILREYIFTAITEYKPEQLLVNFTDVVYTDSSGIATLVEGRQLAQEHKSAFKLIGLSETVLEVFQLVRLERLFDIYLTEEDALRGA